jgi:LPS-assembly protein
MGLLMALAWITLGTKAHSRDDLNPPPVFLASGVSNGLGLKFDPHLDLDPPSSGETPVYIFGKTISGQTDDLIQSEGDGEFRKLGMFIKGELIRHDLVQDELFAEGKVRLFREGEYFEGPRLRMKLGTTQGQFDDVRYYLASVGGRGTAEHVEFIQPLETRLTNATYTTCPIDRPAWELRMSEMTIDQIREVGDTRSSKLYWGDTPILPFGDVSFPIGNRRKTGFLPPSYRTSTKLGFEVEAPFYWNMASEHDLTLYPRIMAKRGAQLGAEFRFLREKSFGTVTAEVLPDDREAGIDRHFQSIAASYRPTDGVTIGLNAQRVSDDQYFSDLGGSLLASSQRLLPATLTMTAERMGWRLQAEAQSYQVLQDVNAPLIRPYSRLPRVALTRAHRANRGEDAYPVDWNVRAEATSFQHPTLAEGDRWVAEGSVAWRHQQGGVSITPKLTLHATQYNHRQDGSRDDTAIKYKNAPLGIYSNNVTDLTESGAVGTESYTRVLPTFSTEISTAFDRMVNVGGSIFQQTIEPKFAYVYTPYKDQSKMPVFDTGVPTVSFTQIFSGNAFNGDDRVADLNQATIGVTSRLISDQDGEEIFRAAIAQQFYFDDQRVTLPGEAVRTDRRSNLLAQLGIRPNQNWTIDSQAQYTPSTEKWQDVSIVSRYNPKPASMLSFSYRFVRGSSNTADFAFQWPVAKNWYAVGRYQKALRNLGAEQTNQNAGLIEALAGVEYDGGCWVARFVAQRYVTNATERNTAVFFQIELNGIGRVGTSPLSALNRSIPNYQMINDLSPMPSRFDQFQ